MKIAIVCNRGGHLTEALQLLDAFRGHELLFVVPHSARDEELQALGRVWFSARVEADPFIFMYFWPWSLYVLQKEKPDIVLSTGTENAIPFFFWARVMRKKTLYLESWCRISDLSITGRIVYPWVDEFWVQWPGLAERFPRAKYMGSVL